MKYRKKPVIVEAIQWTGNNEIKIMEFVGKQLSVNKVPAAMELSTDIPPDGYTIVIPTLEGDMTASKGDYIIKGIAGEFYPCKPSIFEATYEVVV